jgi:MTH538 TIR-like domain (DUF1863)
MTVYDGFVSYSHAKDKPIAAALQSVIQKLGKPWYRRRALRVFLDDTSLSATPRLWPSIEQALGKSRFLILLASPEAATSPWVNKEISWWLDNKSADTLLIAVTDGKLAWDNKAGDFDRASGLPLPLALAGRFDSEPKWVDLSAFRNTANARDLKFKEHAAGLVAAIQGVPKDELLSLEVRQQRRALNLAASAIVSLTALTLIAFWQWTRATDSERKAAAEIERAEQYDTAMKSRIKALAIEGGAGRFTMHPANDAAQNLGILHGEYARNDHTSGVTNILMPGGELLVGRYFTVARGTVGFGQIYSSVLGKLAFDITLFSHPNISMMKPASFGRVEFSGNKGNSMQCEFYRDDVSLNGYGGCSFRDALFRLEF